MAGGLQLDQTADTAQSNSISQEFMLKLDTLFTFLSPVPLFVAAAVVTGMVLCDFDTVGSDELAVGNSSSGHSHVYCASVKMVGTLPSGLPSPQFSFAELFSANIRVWLEAVSISIVILAEHVSNVKLYSTMHGAS